MATPGRTTRSRSRQTTPQPLPAVSVRQSSAYGSRGKANMPTNQLVAERNFATAFTTARAGATVAPVPEESEDDEEELQSQRQGTYVGSLAHYESPVHSEGRHSMPPPSPRPAQAFATATDETPAQPWTLSVILFAIPRYLWRNFWALLVGALLLGTIAHVKMPARAASRRDEFFRGLKIAAGVPGYDQPPEKLERMWFFLRYEAFKTEELDNLPAINDPVLQQAINVRLRGLITDMESNQAALADRVSVLEDYFPSRMVVDVVDGNLVIDERFWHALSEKMVGSNDLFDAFVAANEATITKIAENVAAGYVDKAVNSKRLLDRTGMMVVLEQNSRELEKRLTKLINTGTQEAVDAARVIARQVATEIAENTPSDLRARLSILAKSNVLANTYDAMGSVNWFSPKLGAVIDPHHTSQTAIKPRKVAVGGWFARSLKQVTPSPVTALMPWIETGDCWCASNSETGQVQLAVITEHEIRPERLIVEHIPKGGALDMGSAPLDFQLWAEVFDPEKAEAFRRELREFDALYNQRCDFQRPTSTAVCITYGRYDTRSENWVQSEPMIMDLDYIGLEAGKFYYRVMSNWGSNQTCTYRVRLTAHDSGRSSDNDGK